MFMREGVPNCLCLRIKHLSAIPDLFSEFVPVVWFICDAVHVLNGSVLGKLMSML